jgi:hypothetical protein
MQGAAGQQAEASASDLGVSDAKDGERSGADAQEAPPGAAAPQQRNREGKKRARAGQQAPTAAINGKQKASGAAAAKPAKVWSGERGL